MTPEIKRPFWSTRVENLKIWLKISMANSALTNIYRTQRHIFRKLNQNPKMNLLTKMWFLEKSGNWTSWKKTIICRMPISRKLSRNIILGSLNLEICSRKRDQITRLPSISNTTKTKKSFKTYVWNLCSRTVQKIKNFQITWPQNQRVSKQPPLAKPPVAMKWSWPRAAPEATSRYLEKPKLQKTSKWPKKEQNWSKIMKNRW